MIYRATEDFCTAPELPFRQLAALVDRFSGKCAVIVDDNRRLLGMVTDGDMRRAVLRSSPGELLARDVMKSNPWSLPITSRSIEQIEFMRQRHIHQLPLLDADGRVAAIRINNPLYSPARDEVLVVLMAGGLGTRLRPLTEDRPKSLIDLAGKPIIDHIVARFQRHGFRKFVAAVNYRGDMIREHFANGPGSGCSMGFIQEDKPLGTAGAMSLLSGMTEAQFFVTNCDILTNASYGAMLDFHVEQKAQITVAVVEHHIHVPYGVIETNGFSIRSQREKPDYTYFINAGFYVVDRELAGLVPPNESFDMPDLIDVANRRKLKSVVYPISDYWIDIGRPEDLEAARTMLAGPGN